MPDEAITRVYKMVESLPTWFIIANRKNIDNVLDNKFNSINLEKGILGVSDTNTNTNTDIKYKTTTKPSLKFNDDDGVPDLEDTVCTVDDDNDNDNDDNMSGVQQLTYDDNNDELPGHGYVNDNNK